MDDLPWHVRRRQELEAAAPVRRKQLDAFVKLPLWWAEAVAKAARSPALVVAVELLRLRWKTGRSTFPLPNARLRKKGVSREVKLRVLRDLERAGLVTVEWPPRKAPVVTLVLL
jgi:hypothetical protein